MANDLQIQLKKFFGFDTFKGNQQEIIQNLMDGKDTFVLMPTGGGKSMCYQLPALLLEGTAIIISPLIALMKNQVDAVRGYSEKDGVAHFLNSSLSRSTINEVKRNITAGVTKMLYVAPESLTKEENVNFLKGVKVSFYAVDEAHCISEWGHDFRPEYRRIRPIVNEIGRAPIIALTATAPPKVQHDIIKNLEIDDATIFKSSFNRPNLYYEVRPKQNAQRDIINILRNNPGKSAIIYCLSRKMVEEMAESLNINGIKSVPYHAGLDAATRAVNQDKFLMQEVDVVCATIAFGMGIDKPDVRFVFHYDIPKSLEGYYQETGRAGRDGGEGRCYLFYSKKDVQKLEKFMQAKTQTEKEIGQQLIAETIAYAESNVCRRRTLLTYFGETYLQKNCECCDNCLNPKEQFDAKDAVSLLVEIVSEFDKKFKAEYLLDFVMGVATDLVKSYGHANHELFGKGAEHDRRYWTSVIRQAIVAGYLGKDIETYGLIYVGENANEIDSVSQISFCLDRDFSEVEIDETISFGGTSALDEVCERALKDIRSKLAHRHKFPPHVIFSDLAIENMATYYPMTIDELKAIPGVGESKAKKFGQEILEFIAHYVEENEIERPQELFIKTVGSKSRNKREIICGIDRRTPLDILAESLRLTMAELIKEMESIVYSGSKLKIDYYLNETYDPDQIDYVYAYFKESEDDSIKLAVEEFSDEGEDDYPEELIRLVRIKFVSDVGY